MIAFIWEMFGRREKIKTEKVGYGCQRMGVCRGAVTANGYRGFFLWGEKCSGIDESNGYTAVYNQ